MNENASETGFVIITLHNTERNQNKTVLHTQKIKQKYFCHSISISNLDQAVTLQTSSGKPPCSYPAGTPLLRVFVDSFSLSMQEPE
jgi:hypothetical protein